jgi:hypothetical protein
MGKVIFLNTVTHSKGENYKINNLALNLPREVLVCRKRVLGYETSQHK